MTDPWDALLTLTSERAALEAFLDAQRAELLRTLEGLDDAQARLTPTVSSLSLLGLVKHSATWERRWFEVVVAGRTDPSGWPEVRTDPRDADLHVDEQDTLDHWVAAYRAAIETSRAVAAATDLDQPCARQDLLAGNLRYVMFHLIEETARHAGHADLIREAIDGRRSL